MRIVQVLRKSHILQTMSIMLMTLSLFESYSSTSCEKETLKHLIVGKATLALPFFGRFFLFYSGYLSLKIVNQKLFLKPWHPLFNVDSLIIFCTFSRIH